MDTKKCTCGKETMKDDPQCATCAVTSWKKKERTHMLKERANEQLRMF